MYFLFGIIYHKFRHYHTCDNTVHKIKEPVSIVAMILFNDLHRWKKSSILSAITSLKIVFLQVIPETFKNILT
jgi:hypothetical protein